MCGRSRKPPGTCRLSVATLLERGLDPIDIGHVIGVTVDHLTMRAIDLFIEARGEPPAAFAWVALGSAARHEQALTTDQDHAIAYASGSDPDEIDPYFAALAASVTDALEVCGIQRCSGNVMAVNPAWRRTREGWRQRFGEYIADPDLMGARITGIAFDYRRVTGAVDIEATFDEVIRTAGHDRGFVRRLATTALEGSPPVGRRRDIEVTHRGEHAGRIDIKHEGITIVTNLARVYAIVAGVSENRTAERLRSAASAGVIPDGTRDDLLEAFDVLWGIRLQRHADLMGRGEVADDLVDPTAIAHDHRTRAGRVAPRDRGSPAGSRPRAGSPASSALSCRPRRPRWASLLGIGFGQPTGSWSDGGALSMRRFALVGSAVLLSLTLSIMVVPAAHAAFPGGNGDIAFSRAIHDQSDIWIVFAGVTGTTNLTNTVNRLESQPDYNAAGTRIAYTRCTTEFSNCDIWAMDADGANKTGSRSRPRCRRRGRAGRPTA